MGETKKPVGATDVANEVTDPGRRMTMLGVILNLLGQCGRSQLLAEDSASPAKLFSARRFNAIGVMLIAVVRDSDLAEEEIERCRQELIKAGRKQWLTMAEELMPTKKRRPLTLRVLKQLDALCYNLVSLQGKRDVEADPEIARLSKEFTDDTAEIILKSSLSDEERAEAFESQKHEFRPHLDSATEAGAKVLLDILRKSHLPQPELKTACIVLERQLQREYGDGSSFRALLMYTRDQLAGRIRG